MELTRPDRNADGKDKAHKVSTANGDSTGSWTFCLCPETARETDLKVVDIHLLEEKTKQSKVQALA